MPESKRGSVFIGALLILLGAMLSLFTFIPGLSIGRAWPLIFLILAAGFFLPPFIWPQSRQGLSGLLIPGSILAVLGFIFLYCSLTDDWPFWAFAWILIPFSVGLGLALAASVGGWSRVVFWVGIWMLAISLAIFGLFASLFGSPFIQVAGATLVILAGAGLVLKSFR